MQPSPTPNLPPRVAAFGRAALTLALVATALAVTPGHSAAADPVCESDREHRKLATRLGTDLRAAVQGRAGSISVALFDRERGIGCYLGSGRKYDTASTIKVAVVAALLQTAQKQKRSLTTRERSLAKAAITRSDNNATSTLWSQLGRARLQRLLDDVGMRATTLGPTRYWGISRSTALDQLRLLIRLTRVEDEVLTATSRRYLLGLMNQTVSGQRWGTPAGATGVNVHVKNGWLPRSTLGWRVHSLGTFDGSRRDYMIVVMTHGNPSMTYGITSVERVAKVIHRHLNPAKSSASHAAYLTDADVKLDGDTLPP
ncbi:class A beta-lactamase-related serine hydrolase [Actinocorallia sp. API 0066]|uniref:serine hydrolase n=1 Tax=Actinocorallia sp. API 0066 TaxID=2896846 RepID=UPI001E5B08AE|nr:serine hydrolase [Actinocorallia sp. API 0066]MCD0450671.1 class A beta-lactamase-related serine hydrolase [Actinocorallia sp. API 0066]